MFGMRSVSTFPISLVNPSLVFFFFGGGENIPRISLLGNGEGDFKESFFSGGESTPLVLKMLLFYG